MIVTHKWKKNSTALIQIGKTQTNNIAMPKYYIVKLVDNQCSRNFHRVNHFDLTSKYNELSCSIMSKGKISNLVPVAS